MMADTMAIFFSVLGLMLALPGLWLLCRGLWPSLVAKAAHRCRRGLLKSFFVGAPITTITAVAVVAIAKLGPIGSIISILIASIFFVVASAGVAGFVTSIGERLASPVDSDRPWRATLRGGIVLELSYLLPILGWFVILPVSLIIGCGAASLSLFGASRLFAPESDGVNGPEVSGLGT